MLIEFFTVSLVVLLSGYFFSWYTFPHIWDIVFIIFLVYIICYFLDIVNTSKDLKDIDNLLKAHKRNKKRSDEDENSFEVFKE